MNPKHPPGPPMTLGNMRELGVQNLIASCLNDACRHQALIEVSSCRAAVQSRVKCGKCGGRGNKIDGATELEGTADAADEVTLRLTSAFGRAAEVYRRTTSAAVDANDPNAT